MPPDGWLNRAAGYRIEWDPRTAAPRLGQLPFFAELLQVDVLFAAAGVQGSLLRIAIPPRLVKLQLVGLQRPTRVGGVPILNKIFIQPSVEERTMTLKQTLVSSAAAFTLAVGGLALAEKAESPLVAGDSNPSISQDDAAQLKATDPNAKDQEKTEKMLKEESAMVSGDSNPSISQDDTQLKAPDPNAKEQEKTEEMLKKEKDMISGDQY